VISFVPHVGLFLSLVKPFLEEDSDSESGRSDCGSEGLDKQPLSLSEEETEADTPPAYGERPTFQQLFSPGSTALKVKILGRGAPSEEDLVERPRSNMVGTRSAKEKPARKTRQVNTKVTDDGKNAAGDASRNVR
jgi:hypothetical protein